MSSGKAISLDMLHYITRMPIAKVAADNMEATDPLKGLNCGSTFRLYAHDKEKFIAQIISSLYIVASIRLCAAWCY